MNNITLHNSGAISIREYSQNTSWCLGNILYSQNAKALFVELPNSENTDGQGEALEFRGIFSFWYFH